MIVLEEVDPQTLMEEVLEPNKLSAKPKTTKKGKGAISPPSDQDKGQDNPNTKTVRKAKPTKPKRKAKVTMQAKTRTMRKRKGISPPSALKEEHIIIPTNTKIVKKNKSTISTNSELDEEPINKHSKRILKKK